MQCTVSAPCFVACPFREASHGLSICKQEWGMGVEGLGSSLVASHHLFIPHPPFLLPLPLPP